MNVAETKVTVYDLDKLVARRTVVLLLRATGFGLVLAAIVEPSFFAWEFAHGCNGRCPACGQFVRIVESDKSTLGENSLRCCPSCHTSHSVAEFRRAPILSVTATAALTVGLVLLLSARRIPGWCNLAATCARNLRNPRRWRRQRHVAWMKSWQPKLDR